MFADLRIKSYSLQQDSLDENLRKTLLEDMASTTSFICDVDSILQTKSGYFNYIGIIANYVTYIAGIISAIVLVYNSFSLLSLYF